MVKFDWYVIQNNPFVMCEHGVEHVGFTCGMPVTIYSQMIRSQNGGYSMRVSHLLPSDEARVECAIQGNYI